MSSSRRFGFVLLRFLSEVYLSMMKPRYKLIDTFMLLMNPTGARFFRLSWRGDVFSDQLPVRIKFHRRSSRFHPPLYSVAVSRRRLDPWVSVLSSLGDELASISSGGRSIYGKWHIMTVSLRGMQSCIRDTESFLPHVATQSAVLTRQVVCPSVCPSVTLRYREVGILGK